MLNQTEVWNYIQKYIIKWREIKMAKTTITLPANMVAKATADRSFKFIPYKENFVTTIPAGKSLALKATTVGQYLYYVKQGFIASDEAANITINVPAKITIKNNTDRVMNFIPYRENFQVEIISGDEYEFEAETAGQVLYYMAQDTTGPDVDGGLDVTQAAKA